MIVLSWKKIIKFVGIFCCFAMLIQIAIYINKNEKTIATVTLPVTNKTVVLDAGHPKRLITR